MDPNITGNSTVAIPTATGMFVLQIAMNTFIFVSGFIGNLCVAVIILRKKKMQTVTNWLVLNLAIVDLAIVVLTIPIGIVAMYTKWPLGQIGCIIVFSTLEHFAGVCVLTHTALGMVRCLIVKNSMSLRQVSVNQVRMIIVGIWIFSFIILSVPLMGVFADIKLVDNYSCQLQWKSIDYKIPFFLTAFLVTYVIPMVVSGVSYSYIHFAISDNLKNLYGHMSQQVITSRREKSRHIDKILMIMYVLFGISTLPLQLFYLSDAFHGVPDNFMATSFGENIVTVLQALFYAQVVWNPLVLFFMGEEYRKEIFKLPICSRLERRRRRNISFMVRGSFRGVLSYYRKRKSLNTERRRSSRPQSIKKVMKDKNRNLLKERNINGNATSLSLLSQVDNGPLLTRDHIPPTLSAHVIKDNNNKVCHASSSSDLETQNLIKIEYSNSVSCESELADVHSVADCYHDDGSIISFYDPTFGKICLQYDNGKETIL